MHSLRLPTIITILTALVLAIFWRPPADVVSFDSSNAKNSSTQSVSTQVAPQVAAQTSKQQLVRYAKAPLPCMELGFSVSDFTFDCSEVPVSIRIGRDEVSVNIFVLQATPEVVSNDAPVLYLHGGPAALFDDKIPAAHTWQGYTEVLKGMEGRRLLFMDYPGFGYSAANPTCEALRAITYFESFTDKWDKSEAQCLEDYAQHADPGHVKLLSTSASASAILQVLRQLHYTEVDLVGSSHGTRVALEMMAQNEASFHRKTAIYNNQPGGTNSREVNIRAAVLAGVVSPNMKWKPQDYFNNMSSKLESLIGHCRQIPACAEKYPNLEDRLKEVIDHYNHKETSYNVSYYLHDKITVNEIFVFDLIEYLLASSYAIIEFPKTITRLSDKRFEDIEMVLSEMVFSEQSYYDEGMELVYTMCQDEGMAYSKEDLKNLSLLNIKYNMSTSMESFKTCGDLPHYKGVMGLNEITGIDTPVLLLAGGYDIITDKKYAKRVHKQLAHSHYIEFPYASHALIYRPCFAELSAGFLSAPNNFESELCASEKELPLFK